jgi:hypothetical protein
MKQATKTAVINGALKTIGKGNMAKVLTWAEAHPAGTSEKLASTMKTSEATAARHLREARRVIGRNLAATVLVRTM